MDFSLFAEEYFDEVLRLLRHLCTIPAPSGEEDERVRFCQEYLAELGIEATLDPAKNLLWTLGAPSQRVTLFMAHTDTVFPRTTPLKLADDGTFLRCPGVGDDTANLAVMLACVRCIVEKKLPLHRTLLFAADSCEEGLGNLKGCRQIFADWGDRIDRTISLDCSYRGVYCRSVGSHRYQITAETEGGHSYFAFGNKSAILPLAEITCQIYEIEPPVVGNSKTTYNVGILSGGTSVNTIPQSATMLAEYRSDHWECLAEMETRFAQIFSRAKEACPRLTVERVGDRPCMGEVDPRALDELSHRAAGLIQKYTGICPEFRSGSTDCNIPHSLGIPAIAFGLYDGGGFHTTEEWLRKDSLKPGFCIGLEMILREGEAE